MSEIKNNLPNIMRDKNLNLSELEALTKITRKTLGLFYHQKSFPNKENMIKICDALECNIGDLFYIEKKTLIDLKVN
jgi:DNA-binding Xre family transcriptional regulator